MESVNFHKGIISTLPLVTPSLIASLLVAALYPDKKLNRIVVFSTAPHFQFLNGSQVWSFNCICCTLYLNTCSCSWLNNMPCIMFWSTWITCFMSNNVTSFVLLVFAWLQRLFFYSCKWLNTRLCSICWNLVFNYKQQHIFKINKTLKGSLFQ